MIFVWDGVEIHTTFHNVVGRKMRVNDRWLYKSFGKRRTHISTFMYTNTFFIQTSSHQHYTYTNTTTHFFHDISQLHFQFPPSASQQPPKTLKPHLPTAKVIHTNQTAIATHWTLTSPTCTIPISNRHSREKVTQGIVFDSPDYRYSKPSPGQGSSSKWGYSALKFPDC